MESYRPGRTPCLNPDATMATAANARDHQDEPPEPPVTHHHHHHHNYSHCTFNNFGGAGSNFEPPEPSEPPGPQAAHSSAPNDPLLDITEGQVLDPDEWLASVVQLDPVFSNPEPQLKPDPSLCPDVDLLNGLTPAITANETSAAAMSNQQNMNAQANVTGNDSAAPAPPTATKKSTKKPTKSGTTACLACRTQHLKCDGASPCARCVAAGGGSDDCKYVQSRRGYKGKGPKRGLVQNPNKRQAVSPPEQSGDRYEPSSSAAIGMCAPQGTYTASPGSSAAHTPNSSSTQSHKPSGDASGTDLSTYELSPPTRPGNILAQSLSERCLQSFYTNFHGAHPFVLPKKFLLSVSHEEAVEPLMAAMRWAGSLYIDVPSARESLLQEAHHRLRGIPQERRDGFTLQAMMILIVALDGTTQNDLAREMLLDAEKLAHRIAINTKVFATYHGRGSPVLEESWRRTWWDLLVIDGMIAGVHRVTHFALFDVPADVDLPCEEADFLSGNIPPPRSLEDLEDQDFNSGFETIPFSSFAYRILGIRNLGKFMRTPPISSPSDPNMARIQALLVNWTLHLPTSKRDPLDSTGHVDEMLFQAHMMRHATAILLHQPHSQLDSSPAESITSCAPHQAVNVTNKPFNAHTRHTLTAAAAISHLVSLPVPSLTTHTHFFTCVLTLSSTVHLCKWALHFVQYDDDDLRQLLRLNIGALNELSKVWPAAERARGQIRAVASEIFEAKKEVQQGPQFWMGLEQGLVSGTLAADMAIIEEVDGEQRQI